MVDTVSEVNQFNELIVDERPLMPIYKGDLLLKRNYRGWPAALPVGVLLLAILLSFLKYYLVVARRPWLW